MGAVALVVLSGAAADAVLPVDGAQVRMAEVDAGVDHRHVCATRLPGRRGGRGLHAPHPGGRAVTGCERNVVERLDSPVRRDERHLWIRAQVAHLIRGERRSKALQGTPVAQAALKALGLLELLGLHHRAVDRSFEDDDVAALHALRRARFGGGGGSRRGRGREGRERDGAALEDSR
jgi:hypothetical protein